jgi:lipopolysaccharide/colanic/teichoic acid biosynthesis glycosyltransferase
MKRLFDILLSAFGMVFFFPLGLLFAFFIKLEDGGSIFYVQERWGKYGKKFKAYKFRTMIDMAEETWGVEPVRENDIRVTKVGRFLRATAMDELPQLMNIWKGDMSFVGPRAFAVEAINPTFPQFMERHKIRPGLTGPAQVCVPRDASFEEKFRYDLEYIRNHNFLGDLRLLFLSLWITLRGKWESREGKI